MAISARVPGSITNADANGYVLGDITREILCLKFQLDLVIAVIVSQHLLSTGGTLGYVQSGTLPLNSVPTGRRAGAVGERHRLDRVVRAALHA